MRLWFLVLPVIMAASPQVLAETRVENGVRVHRMSRAPDVTATAATSSDIAAPVGIALDRTYGAPASCASMDWRLSVPRETWQARCGEEGYVRWYDDWINRVY